MTSYIGIVIFVTVFLLRMCRLPISWKFPCDHPGKHGKKWKEKVNCLSGKCVEAGTLTNWYFITEGNEKYRVTDLPIAVRKTIVDLFLEVCWDCGTSQEYSFVREEWKALRVFDMGAAGYRSLVIMCDECCQLVTGFTFRCVNEQCSDGETKVYDLCYKHYNANRHFYNDPRHEFRCIVQTDNTFDQTSCKIPPLKIRAQSTPYKLIGLFPKAFVVLKDKYSEEIGKVVRIVHEEGRTDFRRAKFWNCVAEVNFEWSHDNQEVIEYGYTGEDGKVTLEAVVPGVFSVDTGCDCFYAEHFPSLGCEILQEMSRYHLNLHTLTTGESCFISDFRMRSLHLTGTDLKEIDDKESFWLQCDNREMVNFLDNKLETLPTHLLDFEGSLKIASLSFNCFEKIPEDIFRFNKLVNLNMIMNFLAVLPAEVCRLKNLTNLHLSNNKIMFLPDVFDKLLHLELISFDHNLLTALPHSFRSLKHVRSLSLNDNCFRTFPSELCSLQALSSLQLHNNRIQLIPLEARALALSSCTLYGNPIQIPGIQTFLSNESELKKELKKYFSHDMLSVGRKFLRVLCLGECGSGKTSLVQALCEKTYVTPNQSPRHDHTIGIDRYFYHFTHNELLHELSIWDFAGEKSYAMMNQVFMSSDVLIWVAVNLVDYSPDYYQTKLGIWLRLVLARIPQAHVWIIGTHTDMCTTEEVKWKIANIRRNIGIECDSIYEELSRQHQSLVSEVAKTNHKPDPKFLRRHYKVCKVSNAFGLKGHEQLCSEIEMLPQSEYFQHFFSEVPTRWLEAEELLKHHSASLLRDNKPPVIERVDVLTIARHLSSSEANQLINYLHRSGEILEFTITSNCQQKNKLVLDIAWLIFVFKQIFRHDLSALAGKKLKQSRYYCEPAEKTALYKLKNCAIIEEKLLHLLWNALGDEPVSLLIELLSEFGLAYRSEGQEKEYLFPWFLESAEVPNRVRSGKHITVVYNFAFLPLGFFERLIVHCSQHLNVTEVKRNILSAQKGNHNIVIVCFWNQLTSYKGKIELRISEKVPSPSYSLLWSQLTDLMDKVKYLLQQRSGSALFMCKGFVYEGSLCPQCVQCEELEPEVFDLRKQYEEDNIFCEKCKKIGRPCFISKESIIPPTEATPTIGSCSIPPFEKLQETVLTVDQNLASQRQIVGAQLNVSPCCSTGVVPFSKLPIHISQYNPEMIHILSNQEYCHEVFDPEILQLIYNQHKTHSFRVPSTQEHQIDPENPETSERYFFVPALLSADAPVPQMWECSATFVYRSGWSLQCSDPQQIFKTHFIHILLLRLAFSFTLTLDSREDSDVPPVLQRKCSLWKNGIFWVNMDGIESLVKVGEQSRTVTVIMRCLKGSEIKCIKLRSAVIQKVLKAKEDFCPDVLTDEHLIYPMPPANELTTFSMHAVAQAILQSRPAIVNNTQELVTVEELLYFEPYANMGESIISELFDEQEPRYKEVISDGFLYTIADQVYHKIDLFQKLLGLPASSVEFHQSQAPSGPAHAMGHLLVCWKERSDGSRQCLRQKLDQFSVFAGRNPQDLTRLQM